eukprot:TRINITY_DN19127_c0_g1_i1.p1 TRINITY_DN19127_c0_g1~~TRINITY_DN19127_c0_g1_i1.p1  ORF type:complete len:1179 (+),score=460.65 TRINITY_DN19127_c0_g1_i1:46-3537(+)
MPGRKKACVADADAEVRRVFDAAQRTTAGHQRLCADLRRVAEQKGVDALTEAVLKVLPFAIASQASKAVERVVRFVRTFAESRRDNVFQFALIGGCSRYLQCECKSARRNACELMAACVSSLRDGEEETDAEQATADRLVQLLHDRLDDKNSLVRSAAVKAICVYQEPDRCLSDDRAERCDVVQHMLQLLGEETQASVRHDVLASLSIGTHCKNALLLCVRDPSQAVRRQAYIHLRRVGPKSLRPLERVDVATRGLTDRDTRVRLRAAEMLEKWMERCGGDAVETVALFDIETAEGLSEKVAHELYRLRYRRPRLDGAASVDAWDVQERSNLLPPQFSETRPEGVLLLRVVTERLLEDDPDRADVYLPDMEMMHEMLVTCVSAITGQLELGTDDDESFAIRAPLVAEQLLKVCLHYQFDVHTADQKKKLTTVLFALLCLPQVIDATLFVGGVLALFREFYGSDGPEYHERVTAAVVNLRKSMSGSGPGDADEDVFFDAEAQAALGKRRQRLIAEAKAAAAAGEDQQALLSRLVSEQATDDALWLRTLAVITNVLEHTPRGARMDPVHADMARETAQNHHNYIIRGKALRLLAVYSVADRAVAPTFAQVFMSCLRSPFQSSAEAGEVMEASLKGLADILLEHGAKGMEAEQVGYGTQTESQPTPELQPHAEEGAAAAAAFSVLLQFLAHGDAAGTAEVAGDRGPAAAERRTRLQSVSVCSFIKLLSVNRVAAGMEVKVLAQLLLFFFNPANGSGAAKDGDDEAEAQHPARLPMQQLALFLPVYAHSSQPRQQLVSQAALLALRHLVRDSHAVLPDPRPRRRPPPAGRKAADLTPFLTYAAYLTDAKELREMQRLLRERQLLHEPADDEEDTADDASVSRTMRVVAPRKRTAKQQEVLERLAACSLHEGLAVKVLAEVSSEYNLDPSGEQHAKTLVRLLPCLRFYSRFDTAEIRAAAHLCKTLAESCAPLRGTLAKAAEAVQRLLLSDYGVDPAAVALAAEEQRCLDERVRAHEAEWQQYVRDSFAVVAAEAEEDSFEQPRRAARGHASPCRSSDREAFDPPQASQKRRSPRSPNARAKRRRTDADCPAQPLVEGAVALGLRRGRWVLCTVGPELEDGSRVVTWRGGAEDTLPPSSIRARPEKPARNSPTRTRRLPQIIDDDSSG